MVPLIVSGSVLFLICVALFMNTIAEWIDFKVYRWEDAKERRARRGQKK